MRTLLGLPLVIVLSACVADVEQGTQPDDHVPTEQPGSMAPYDEGNDPRDPCSVAFAFDENGDLLSVPTECTAPWEVEDDGDPPPDEQSNAEQSILPH